MTDTVTRAEHEALLARVADLEDALAMRDAKAEDDGTRIPHAVVRAEVAGDHPITAWRKHRGLTARQLAERAGVSAAYLSEIVSGRKPGSVAAFKALAAALDAPLDALIGD